MDTLCFQGDSGGPLICLPQKTFCGVISGSDKCRPGSVFELNTDTFSEPS